MIDDCDSIKNFPFPTLREKQRDVLNEVDSTFNSGYRYIILEAAVGFGKSAVANVICSDIIPQMDILEVLSLAKSRSGILSKDRTMIDEDGCMTFGYVSNNHIIEVSIPLGGIKITTLSESLS